MRSQDKAIFPEAACQFQTWILVRRHQPGVIGICGPARIHAETN